MGEIWDVICVLSPGLTLVFLVGFRNHLFDICAASGDRARLTGLGCD